MKNVIAIALILLFVPQIGFAKDPTKKELCDQTIRNHQPHHGGRCESGDSVAKYSCCYDQFYEIWFGGCPKGTTHEDRPTLTEEGVVVVACGTKDKDGKFVRNGPTLRWSAWTERMMSASKFENGKEILREDYNKIETNVYPY